MSFFLYLKEKRTKKEANQLRQLDRLICPQPYTESPQELASCSSCGSLRAER